MRDQEQKELSIYVDLADLFEYPESNLVRQIAVDGNTNLSESLTNFMVGIENFSLSDLQELYTRTFDLNPVCALEIGYHLFGENYKRGEFLANLRETEAPFQLGQDKQLPDYMPVLLRLITKLDDEELRTALIVDCMAPAIDKMIASLKDGENPYRYLLETVQLKLRSEKGVNVPPTSNRAGCQRASLPVFQPAEQALKLGVDH